METKDKKQQRPVKCSTCKNLFDKSELIQSPTNKSKRFCKKCYETSISNAEQYKSLIEAICQGFGLKAPTGQQQKEIKKFKEQGLSYAEMQYTLYYIYEILGKKVVGTSLGLIPYYHKEALEHEKRVIMARESLRDAVKHQQDIVIVRNLELTTKANKDKTRLIDIQKII